MNLATLSTLAALGLLLKINLTLGQKKNPQRFYGVYEASHFAAGFLLAWLFSSFWENGRLIWLAVMVVGILWEVWEGLIFKNKKIKKWAQKHLGQRVPSWSGADTLLDLFLDGAGAMIFLIWF